MKYIAKSYLNNLKYRKLIESPQEDYGQNIIQINSLTIAVLYSET